MEIVINLIQNDKIGKPTHLRFDLVKVINLVLKRHGQVDFCSDPLRNQIKYRKVNHQLDNKTPIKINGAK